MTALTRRLYNIRVEYEFPAFLTEEEAGDAFSLERLARDALSDLGNVPLSPRLGDVHERRELRSPARDMLAIAVLMDAARADGGRGAGLVQYLEWCGVCVPSQTGGAP
jgi:hypothetical protein